MKLKTKKPLVLLLGLVYALTFSLSSFGVAYAACTDLAPCRPYFKAFGADVMAGGWFYEGGYCSTDASSNYQDPNYPKNPVDGISKSPTNGGILAFAKDSGANSAGGASSQYAAFTAGGVEGDNTKSYGFYSAGALAAASPTAKNLLSFANTGLGNPSLWSGLFEGSVRQTNCVPDYYSKMPSSGVTPLTTSGIFAPPSGSGTFSSYNYFRDTAPSVWDLNSLSGTTTISANTSVTVYIKGNVYIGNNIQYAAFNANNVPKFALVVQGSIYIAPNVTQLDGVYIAQPLPDPAHPNAPVTSDTGNIWTCHDATTISAQYAFPAYVACGNTLVVNGALIAKQVMLMRIKGDVGLPAASTAEDNLAAAISGGNIAEIINYTPAMVIGGPFFGCSSCSNSGDLPVDSLISLPPVF